MKTHDSTLRRQQLGLPQKTKPEVQVVPDPDPVDVAQQPEVEVTTTSMTNLIKKVLKQRVVVKKIINGVPHRVVVTRAERAAESFVQQMENGTYLHFREFLDRTEGKVLNKIGGPSGEPIKMYVGMPVEGDDAP